MFDLISIFIQKNVCICLVIDLKNWLDVGVAASADLAFNRYSSNKLRCTVQLLDCTSITENIVS